MVRMIERLYSYFYRRPECKEEKRRIRSNEALLKRDFSKWQKKILLRMIDDQSMICEKISMDSFEKGFRLGLKLATEIYEWKGVLSDDDSDGAPLF